MGWHSPKPIYFWWQTDPKEWSLIGWESWSSDPNRDIPLEAWHMQPNASTTARECWVPNCQQPWVKIVTYYNADSSNHREQWQPSANYPFTDWILNDEFVKCAVMQRRQGAGQGQEGQGA